MQIVCPACAAAYEVPMTLLKPGKAVRCARCAGEWVPSPAAASDVSMDALPQAAFAAAPASEFVPEGARPSRRPPIARPLPPRRNMALRVAWAASVVAVLLLGWGAYAERTMIMQAWPPSIRLYAALGLAAGN
jgi:predicted Zn finger-like uncharacterized protein